MVYDVGKEVNNEPLTKKEERTMTSIRTKYFGPTNTRGSRIKATLEGGRDYGKSVTIGYPYEYSGVDVHRAAASALCTKLHLPWDSDEWVYAPLDTGYIFIQK
jgi:hypothetical protein